MESLREQFRKDGYLHIKGFFTDEEISEFKNRSILFHSKVYLLMKEILGEGVFQPFPPDIRTKNYPSTFRYFHTDTHEDDEDFSKEYGVVETGIYLQDYSDASGGLKVIPGSHKRPCSKKIALRQALFDRNTTQFDHSLNIKSKAGDFIIWDVRTHHSGNFVALNFCDWSVPPILERFIPSFLRKPKNPERDVIFTFFAKNTQYLSSFVEGQQRRYSHNAKKYNSAVI